MSRLFGSKREGDCTCPKRLAFGTVDSLIGTLRSIFLAAGRGGDDSSLPGYGNPAASKLVKEYLAAVRIEQLESRVLPSQADPFFISDLAAVAAHIGSRVNKMEVSPISALYFDQTFSRHCSSLGTGPSILAGLKLRSYCIFLVRKDYFSIMC